ncbi:MAG: glucose-1-phosphate adenylyltransferase [Elusimicrobia bacterium]|nr:glucose-1-phosphate adenylyltransferase [Elusimicrobiota bacterium]
MDDDHRGLERKTLAVIMGGGAGKRLFPLTRMRAKPAVPFGGKYRLVDIPISNCINSGIEHIFLLTQFNSASLHKHVKLTYHFDVFSNGFVEILAAQQTPAGSEWYQGTADAVRQNLRYLALEEYPYVLILSGDQLYRIDFAEMLARHAASKADITVAAMPVARSECCRMGILAADAEGRITRFVEKPGDEAALAGLALDEAARRRLDLEGQEPAYLANMGIYIFNREKLAEALDNDLTDFGHHIMPRAIGKLRVLAYPCRGYWEDIGTIRSFFDANIALTDYLPRFDFFEPQAPIYTHARALPASKVNGGMIKQAVLSDGCIIDDSRIERSVVGLRSIISAGCDIAETVIMGADFYERGDVAERNRVPRLGIGRGCRIHRAIIDKNARIGEGSVITPEGKPPEFDAPNYFIRDGIVVIPKNAVLPPETRF